MGYSTMPARRLGGRRRIHGLWLAALTILGVIALPAAAAQADALWTGASSSPEWNASTPSNWDPTSTTPPTTNSVAAGTITFPDLGSTSTCTTTCYTSHNGLTGISATGLVFSNTTAGTQYHILGNGLTLGSGGITDDSGGATGDVINTPLALSANQMWTIGGGFNAAYNSVSLANTATVTGNTATLGVTFPSGPGTSFGGDLFVAGDVEVGAVSVTGSGGLHVGASGSAGSVNGSDGNPVGITNKAALIANPGATVGPLTSTGGKLILGTGSGNSAPTTLGVNGAVVLDSATTTTTLIDNNGSTAGTDFSQVSASGNVTLAGTLSIGQGQVNGACAALSRGDVATLITTTGTLSGAFSNAAEGQVLTLGSTCPGAQVQIHYTSNSVTATVVSGTTPTTTTLATPNPSTATTNQKVTLTATVATNTNSTIAPAGTMGFSANGSAISGCTSQAITVSGSSATATCTATFAAGGSPESLTAAFAPTSGSNQASSSSSAQTLTVNKSTTGTTLAASNTNPSAGDSVTYTATVTPGVDGATKPAGTVRFMDGGTTISGCDARSLTSGTATCTVSYSRGGSHTITADYAGDANFTGSSAPATTVTVKAPPPPHKTTGKLLGPGGRLTVIGNTIRFTQKCQSKVLCRGGFEFTATARGKNKKVTTVRCASGSFRIRAGRSATIRVTLSKACLRLLRAQRHHRLTVIYTSRSSTGQVGQRKQITLVLR